jgi:hypothetical protein
MAKVLNSTSFNGNISKMVELRDEMIVNGICCDKVTLSPNPLDYCPVYVSNNNEVIMNQVAYMNSTWFRNFSTNGFLVDSNDPYTYYVATESISGNGINQMIQIKRTSNGLITSTQWGNWDIGTYRGNIDLIAQDSNNIYYTFNREYGGYYSYIGYYNKLTGGGASLNINSGTVQLLKDVGIYLYVYTPSVSANTINVGKYNKTTNTMTWIYTESGANGYYGDNLISDIDNNGVFFLARDGFNFGKIDHYFVYRKYILNTNNDLVTASTVTVDMSLLPNNSIFINSGNAMATCSQLLKFTDSNTGKRYITHLYYNKGLRYTNLSALDSAMYTYEMISDDNWKLVSYYLFNPIIYRTCLSINNGQFLMLAYENACHIYMWDTSSTSYKKTSGFESPINSISCDMNNNMYVQYSDSSIELVSKTMPTTVYADFDQDIYAFSGSEVSANVSLYIQNYQGKYISTSVQLTLYGNVRFTSNNTKTLTITSSNSGKINIPVTIFDEGNYQVKASIVTN